MTRRIACIVEGHGEVESLPVLIRRIHAETPTLRHPVLGRNAIFRVPRSRLLREGELERSVELAARRVGPDGAVLILLDADDDPPCQLGPETLARATQARSDIGLSVVIANREYEAWFIASARSLARALGTNVPVPAANPEDIRDAKGWVAELMPDLSYRPTLEQAGLSALMDLEEARTAASFKKFERDVRRLLAPDESAPVESGALTSARTRKS